MNKFKAGDRVRIRPNPWRILGGFGKPMPARFTPGSLGTVTEYYQDGGANARVVEDGHSIGAPIDESCLESVEPEAWPDLKPGDMVVPGPDWDPDQFLMPDVGLGPWKVAGVRKGGGMVHIQTCIGPAGVRYAPNCHRVQLAPGQLGKPSNFGLPRSMEDQIECLNTGLSGNCGKDRPIYNSQPECHSVSQLATIPAIPTCLRCPRCTQKDLPTPHGFICPHCGFPGWRTTCPHPAEQQIPMRYTPGMAHCLDCRQVVEAAPVVQPCDCMTTDDLSGLRRRSKADGLG